MILMTPWRNKLFKGDCLNIILQRLQDLKGEFRLIYIDPPFLSGTEYTLKQKSQPSAESAASLSEIVTYSDKWEGIDQYLKFMKPRLKVMRDLLTSDGSLWVHLDWHVSHYVKVILDEIFGYDNFVNEVIWKRTNSPKVQSRGFGAQHDVILLYARDSQHYKSKPVYRKHDTKSLKPYSYEDDRGKFRLIEIEAQGIQRSEGRKQFEWRGRTAPYLYRKETLEKWWKEGIIYRSKNGRYTKKQYLEDSKGIQVSDLWFDIPPVQGASQENTGFLTQKPEALLERIVQSSTEEGDIIGDFFAGSGTTGIIADKLARRWILCEQSEAAIEVISHRMKIQGRDIDYEYLD